MKQLSLLGCLVIGLNSCLKIEQVPNCNRQTPVPELSGDSFTVAAGQTLQITNSADTINNNFIWEAPNDSSYIMPSLNAFIYNNLLAGSWSVYTQNRIDSCKSDKVFFTVNVTSGAPPCNLTGNYFKVGTNASSYVQSTSVTSNSSYYLARFNSPGSFVNRLELTFRQPPVANQAYVVVNKTNIADVQNDECVITALVGSTFNYGKSGIVYVLPVSGKLKFVFCDALIGNANSNYPNSQASVVLD